MYAAGELISGWTEWTGLSTVWEAEKSDVLLIDISSRLVVEVSLLATYVKSLAL